MFRSLKRSRSKAQRPKLVAAGARGRGGLGAAAGLPDGRPALVSEPQETFAWGCLPAVHVPWAGEEGCRV